MISLIRILCPNLCRNASFNVSKSTIFTEDRIKIDNFKKLIKYYEKRNSFEGGKYIIT